MARQSDRELSRRLLAATFLLWFSMYTYPSFLAAYAQEEMQAGAMLVGMITGSYGLTQMLLRIPLGLWSDLIRRRKPFLVAGIAAAVVASIGLMCAKSAYGLLIFRALSGVAASTWVMYSVMYSSCFEAGEIQHALGKLSFYQYGSQVVAMLLGALLADRIGKGAAFALAAAAGAAGVMVTLTIRDVPQTGPRQTLRDFAGVLGDKRLLTGTLLSTVFHFVCWGTVLGFTVNWAKGVIGLTTAQLGFLSAAYLLPNTLVARVSGPIAEKTGRRAAMTGGFLLVAAASFLYGQTRAAWQLFAVQILFGCGMGLIVPMTMADAIANIPDERRGAAMGFYQSVYGLGMFLGPVAAGAVVERFSTGADLAAGYRANFAVMAAVGLLGAVIAWIFGKNARKHKA